LSRVATGEGLAWSIEVVVHIFPFGLFHSLSLV